jgi:hypothetical protein
MFCLTLTEYELRTGMMLKWLNKSIKEKYTNLGTAPRLLLDSIHKWNYQKDKAPVSPLDPLQPSGLQMKCNCVPSKVEDFRNEFRHPGSYGSGVASPYSEETLSEPSADAANINWEKKAISSKFRCEHFHFYLWA